MATFPWPWAPWRAAPSILWKPYADDDLVGLLRRALALEAQWHARLSSKTSCANAFSGFVAPADAPHAAGSCGRTQPTIAWKMELERARASKAPAAHL